MNVSMAMAADLPLSTNGFDIRNCAHTMNTPVKELYSQHYFEYLSKVSKLRKLIRMFYLNDIKKYCLGKTIDFGCGVGDLLAILPKESIGLEVNEMCVDYCKSKGLKVEIYHPDQDEYRFDKIPEGKYSSFTMNHVLEHLENSGQVIKKIFDSCNRLGVKKIIITVPGSKGYLADDTHRTFIDTKFIKEIGLLENRHYRLNYSKYFPVNWAKFSRYFKHNELRLVFEQRND